MADGSPARSLADRIGLAVALVTGIAGATVGALNAWFYFEDRRERAQKEDFDNQVTIARLYFERVAGTNFCERRLDAMLFGKASLAMAGLRPEQVGALLGAPEAAQGPGQAGALGPGGTRALAVLVYSELDKRDREECQGRLVTVAAAAPTAPGQVVDAVPPAGNDAGDYSVAPRPPAAATAGDAYTVYIQYLRDSGDAEGRARTLRQKITDLGSGFAAPGTQAVRQVPDRDQIRIYRAADADKAKELQAKLNLEGAQIVNLEKAFRNLPPRTLEVWLGRTPS